jgi:hypothetical protein
VKPGKGTGEVQQGHQGRPRYVPTCLAVTVAAVAKWCGWVLGTYTDC